MLAKHGLTEPNSTTTTEPNSSHRNTSDKTTTSIAPVCGMTPNSILPETGGGVGWGGSVPYYSLTRPSFTQPRHTLPDGQLWWSD